MRPLAAPVLRESSSSTEGDIDTLTDFRAICNDVIKFQEQTLVG